MTRSSQTYAERIAALESSPWKDAVLTQDAKERLALTFVVPGNTSLDVPVFRQALIDVGRVLGVEVVSPPQKSVPCAVIVLTCLFPEAEAVYCRGPPDDSDAQVHSLPDAVDAALDQLLETAGPSDVALVHDLLEPIIPPAGIQDLVEEAGLQERIWRANLELTSRIRNKDNPRIRLVPAHRALTPDLLTIGMLKDFGKFSERLEKMGRPERATQYWQGLLDAAWFHWQWLCPIVYPAKKLIAVDLDDTLWRGTLGEEGIENLACGWSPPTTTFALLQARLRALTKQGTIVAAVSRNDPDEAEQALTRYAPELGLAGKKISLMINKANAIKEICQQFANISPDAVVFIDDNWKERYEATKQLPAVIAPPFASPPATIDDLFLHVPFFERLRISPEDAQRNQFFMAQQSGNIGHGKVSTIVNPTDSTVLDRLADLHTKTNQFNMMTPRTPREKLEMLSQSQDTFLIAFKVEIPGSGLNPEIAGCAEVRQSNPTQWTIASFLMSCRYMGGGTDRRMLAALIEEVSDRGGQSLVALYCPTDRNTAFKEWYPTCGFRQRDDPPDEGSVTFESHLGQIRKRLGVDQAGELLVDQAEEVEEYLARNIRLTTPPNPAPKDRVREKDGSTEILMPEGTFTPGLTPEAAETTTRIFGMKPVGETEREGVRVASFWMDRACVTQGQFCRFLDEEVVDLKERRRVIEELCGYEGDCQLEFDDSTGGSRSKKGTEQRPAVVPIEWAKRYACWAGARLPTEDEWEWAARGPDGRWFPWGNEAPDGIRLCYRNPTAPCDTDAFKDGKSPFGLVGMTGNVWQWCEGEYRGHAPFRGGDHKVDSLYLLRITVRPLESAEKCGHSVGFRLARDP